MEGQGRAGKGFPCLLRSGLAGAALPGLFGPRQAGGRGGVPGGGCPWAAHPRWAAAAAHQPQELGEGGGGGRGVLVPPCGLRGGRGAAGRLHGATRGPTAAEGRGRGGRDHGGACPSLAASSPGGWEVRGAGGGGEGLSPAPAAGAAPPAAAAAGPIAAVAAMEVLRMLLASTLLPLLPREYWGDKAQGWRVLHP